MPYQPDEISILSRQIYIFSSLVTKLAGRDQEQRIAAQLPGVTGLQFGVMQILREGEFTSSEIAQKMMLAPATLVPVVDRLVKDRIVVRNSDPNDRRRAPLSLTEIGRKSLAKISPFDEQDLMARSLHAMGEAKARQLDELLRELLHQLSPDNDYVGQVVESLNRTEIASEE